MTRSHLVATGVLLSLPAFAATPPPEIAFEMTWNATVQSKPATGLTMGLFKVTFEESTLDQVKNAALAGHIEHKGDAGESTYWLCYTNQTKNGTERIWIIAHGEMGGPDHAIGRVSAEPTAASGGTNDCPALPAKMQPVSLDNGLWLNTPETAVNKLGKPSNKSGAWRSYEHQGKVPGECEGGFDVLNWLQLKTSKGRVVTLHAGQVTSC
ncbi:MAG: hypothetical protein WAU48_14910 [Gammaproteobacteria bacterium]